jgi:hypothetical protein
MGTRDPVTWLLAVFTTLPIVICYILLHTPLVADLAHQLGLFQLALLSSCRPETEHASMKHGRARGLSAFAMTRQRE